MADFDVKETTRNVRRVECDKDGDDWTCDIFDSVSTDTDAPDEFQDPASTVRVEDVEVFDGRDNSNIDEVLTSRDYDVSFYFYGNMACQVLNNENTDGGDDLYCSGRYGLKGDEEHI